MQTSRDRLATHAALRMSSFNPPFNFFLSQRSDIHASSLLPVQSFVKIPSFSSEVCTTELR